MRSINRSRSPPHSFNSLCLVPDVTSPQLGHDSFVHSGIARGLNVVFELFSHCETKLDAAGGRDFCERIETRISSARKSSRESHSIQVGSPRKRGKRHLAPRRRCENAFNEQTRIVAHFLNRRVQIGGRVLWRLETVAGPMILYGHLFSPVCTLSSKSEPLQCLVIDVFSSRRQTESRIRHHQGRSTTRYPVLSQKYLTIRPPIHPVSQRCLRSPTCPGRPALWRLASRATRRTNSGNLFPGQDTAQRRSVARILRFRRPYDHRSYPVPRDLCVFGLEREFHGFVSETMNRNSQYRFPKRSVGP